MKTAVVTACDKKYIPGVKALYASYMQNANHDGEFYLLAHGEKEDFEGLKDIKILFNQNTIRYPGSSNWPELPSMYSRLMIPRLFYDYDRVLWLDADTLILRDINPLLNIDLGDTPCAGMLAGDHRVKNVHNNWMPFQFEEPHKFPEYQKEYAIQAGVVLFDPKVWTKLGLNEKADKALLSGIKFKFVVQGLMGYILQSNFTQIPHVWNARISKTANLDGINILHYVGGKNRNPWEAQLKFGKEWNHYYESFSLL